MQNCIKSHIHFQVSPSTFEIFNKNLKIGRFYPGLPYTADEGKKKKHGIGTVPSANLMGFLAHHLFFFQARHKWKLPIKMTGMMDPN